MTGQDIQDLIDSALEREGSFLVTVRSGKYLLSRPLRVKSGVKLRGEPGVILHTTNPNVNFIELVPGSDRKPPNRVEISGLHLQGPRASNANITSLVSGKNKGCGIYVDADQGKAFAGSKPEVHTITIKGCTIENLGGCGIRFLTRGEGGVLMRNIKILDCHLRQNGRPAEAEQNPAPWKDIFFSGTQFEDIEIKGNTCEFTPSTQAGLYGNDAGIAFVPSFDNKEKKLIDGEEKTVLRPRDRWVLGHIRNSEISGNTCSGHRRHGIVANYSFLLADGVTLEGNVCHDNRWTGIYVNTARAAFSEPGFDTGNELSPGDRAGVTIVGNECRNNGYGGIKKADATTATDKSIRGGIVLNRGYNAKIVRNTCNNNGKPSNNFVDPDITRDFAAGILVRGNGLTFDANETTGNVKPNDDHDEVVKWSPYGPDVKFEPTGIMPRVAAPIAGNSPLLDEAEPGVSNSPQDVPDPGVNNGPLSP